MPTVWNKFCIGEHVYVAKKVTYVGSSLGFEKYQHWPIFLYQCIR